MQLRDRNNDEIYVKLIARLIIHIHCKAPNFLKLIEIFLKYLYREILF